MKDTAMGINQLPVPQRTNDEQQHHIIQLVLIGITCTWAIVFVIGIGLSHGSWAAWWFIVVLGVAVMIIRGAQATHEKYKDHQLHQQDIKGREHHHALAQMTISLDHSAEQSPNTWIQPDQSPSKITIWDKHNLQPLRLSNHDLKPSLKT